MSGPVSIRRNARGKSGFLSLSFHLFQFPFPPVAPPPPPRVQPRYTTVSSLSLFPSNSEPPPPLDPRAKHLAWRGKWSDGWAEWEPYYSINCAPRFPIYTHSPSVYLPFPPRKEEWTETKDKWERTASSSSRAASSGLRGALPLPPPPSMTNANAPAIVAPGEEEEEEEDGEGFSFPGRRG